MQIFPIFFCFAPKKQKLRSKFKSTDEINLIRKVIFIEKKKTLFLEEISWVFRDPNKKSLIAYV